MQSSSRKIKAPFFVVNPKNFLYGEELLDLAQYADEITKELSIDILFTAPTVELAVIAERCPNLLITAQHMDSIEPGNSMGRIMAESLKHVGVDVVVLNHADYPLSVEIVLKTIQRAKEVGLQTIVCADSVQEAKALAMLEPDILLAEPTSLIGKPQTSDRQYVEETIAEIKKINPNILVEQGAGIRSEEDVLELLRLGADGVGVTSGIVKADDPKQMMKNMIHTVASYSKERK